MSRNLASYANKNARKFQPDKDRFDTILEKDPVPSNIEEPLKLDEFMISTLRESKKTYTRSLETIHKTST